MKLAQINLTRSIYIPGIGGTVKLENMECEQGQGGILVTTSAAKVLIPWERVESVVTEWIGFSVGKLSAPAVAAMQRMPPGEVSVAKLGPTLAASDGIVAMQQNSPLTMAEIAANDAAIEQAKADARDIVEMTEKSDRDFKKNAEAFEAFHREVAKEMLPIATAVIEQQRQPTPPQKKGGRR